MSEALTALTSYLGTSPVCDVCGKSIKSGDKVLQQFIGTVSKDDMVNELGILESAYTLVHVTCERKN